MSEWYCPNCGISDSKGDYRDDMFICAGCDRQQFKRTPPAFVTAMQEEIAALRAKASEQEWEYASVVNQFHDAIKHNTALEKACAASAKCYPIVGIDVTSRTSYFDRKRMAEALRSAGYLGGGE